MSESDELFTREDPIFVNKELLEINHLPDEGRIVGRDDEISKVAAAVNPAIFGQSPSNVLIYGKTGTGKSLCAKYVSTRLVETAAEEDINAETAYVDCARPSRPSPVNSTTQRLLMSISRIKASAPQRTTSGSGQFWTTSTMLP